MIQSRKQRCKAGCLLIRSAVPEDAAVLLNLTRSVIAEERYQVTELSEFRTTVEQEEKWIRKISDSPDGLLLVAEARGEIIGMLNFHREKKKRLRHTGFFGMSVCKEWRGNKVGFTLLRTLFGLGQSPSGYREGVSGGAGGQRCGHRSLSPVGLPRGGSVDWTSEDGRRKIHGSDSDGAVWRRKSKLLNSLDRIPLYFTHF